MESITTRIEYLFNDKLYKIWEELVKTWVRAQTFVCPRTQEFFFTDNCLCDTLVIKLQLFGQDMFNQWLNIDLIVACCVSAICLQTLAQQIGFCVYRATSVWHNNLVRKSEKLYTSWCWILWNGRLYAFDCEPMSSKSDIQRYAW